MNKEEERTDSNSIQPVIEGNILDTTTKIRGVLPLYRHRSQGDRNELQGDWISSKCEKRQKSWIKALSPLSIDPRAL